MASAGAQLLILAELWTLSSCLLHQYHFVNEHKNWMDAQRFCRDTYTDLATVTNIEEMNQIISIADQNSFNERAWMGLYNDVNSWRWSLSDSDFYGQGESEFRMWKSGQPDNVGGRQTCVQMEINGEWQDADCGDARPFICYDQGQDDFLLITNTTTWSDAQSYCREHHTDLASVRNQSENQRVHSLVPSETWIGLFRDAWKWSDGNNSSYTNWVLGEPNNFLTRQENCGEFWMFSEGKWNDEVCSLKRKFFCHTELSTTTSSPTTTTPELSPSTSKAHVICTDNFMAIELERSAAIGLHEDHLRLNNPDCTPYSNGTHVLANMSLSTCGTVMEDDGEYLIFRNELVSFDDPRDVITRRHDVEIEFYCKYSKKSRVMVEFDAHRPPLTFIQKGFGSFTYQFEFFESDQFSQEKDPNTYPLEFDLGDMMYMQIESISSVSNTELFAESCNAAPSDNPDEAISYPIVKNGCKVDESVQFYSSHQSKVQLGMKAFKFIGLHDQVFITCSVIMCQAGVPGSRCSQGCANSPSSGHQLVKREAPIQTAKHYISQGPLRLRRGVATTVAQNTVNLNNVFVVGGLLAAVAMVCGVVIYKTGGSKVKYERVSSSPFEIASFH